MCVSIDWCKLIAADKLIYASMASGRCSYSLTVAHTTIQKCRWNFIKLKIICFPLLRTHLFFSVSSRNCQQNWKKNEWTAINRLIPSWNAFNGINFIDSIEYCLICCQLIIPRKIVEKKRKGKRHCWLEISN